VAGALAASFTVAVLSSLVESRAQDDIKPKPSNPQAAQAIEFNEPDSFRVYQRGRDGTGEISISLDKAPEGTKVLGVELEGLGEVRFEDGKVRGIPPGRYTPNVLIETATLKGSLPIPNVFVGDLWVLAGQSNMEGVGDLLDITPPSDMVMLLGMDGKWSKAREPLHWLVDSPDPVHSGDPETRAARSADLHKRRTKGTGLGLPFAVALTEATGVPIGLIACAHGGTSMEQWDPTRKSDDGKSLYGSMLRQIRLAGGKVKGVLWYQGESDADPARAEVYQKVFTDFIKTLRADLKQPDLPFYYVQIGRWIRAGDPKPWNLVQDTQRRLVDLVPNTAVVAGVDLELDDGIHVGTPGLKRIGHRLARIAQRELFGKVGATTPTLDRVVKGSGNTLVVKFKGVNLTQDNTGAVGLWPSRNIRGFSIRQEDGTDIPLIFDAAVATARDTVLLKLSGKIPENASLWYGYGFDSPCDLVDALDMAVPVFGPIPLEDVK
jgi:sialate O-acetylesterase